MRRLRLLLRWSGRDLRSRWVQVGAIALIVALGSGFYSGLSSTSAWRRDSYDASYAATHLYDLRLTLSTGSYLPADTLRAVARGIPDASQVRAASPRLTGAIHIYGGDFFAPGRSEWDAETLVERPFDVEGVRKTFREANERSLG